MIKDLYDGHAAQAAYLKNLSYRYVETEPNMVLDLRPEWKGYDDYLASLSSKYRSGIRNAVFKPIEEAGCRVERLSVDEAVQAREELFALYKAVQSNASFRPFELNAAYFGRLLQTATSDHALCSVIRREDRLLGFLITIADGDTAIAYHIGFDRQEAAAFPLYLRLLHAGIEDAISFGCRRISYGRTALEPKASLGAKPQQFGVMVRHCQPVLNKLMKRMLTGIEHDDAPQRNPFKKAA
jgi:predicted N-acyltransferase